MSSLLVGNGINNISNNINWKELLIDLMRSIDKENIINLDKKPFYIFMKGEFILDRFWRRHGHACNGFVSGLRKTHKVDHFVHPSVRGQVSPQQARAGVVAMPACGIGVQCVGALGPSIFHRHYFFNLDTYQITAYLWN